MVNTPFRTSAGGGGTSGISGGARCCYSVSREDCLRVVTDLSGLYLAFLKEGFTVLIKPPLPDPLKTPPFFSQSHACLGVPALLPSTPSCFLWIFTFSSRAPS